MSKMERLLPRLSKRRKQRGNGKLITETFRILQKALDYEEAKFEKSLKAFSGDFLIM